MDIGKLPNNVLKEIILDKIKNKRKEVLIRPKIGEDCSALNLSDNLCVLSTDPITGATKDIGRIAVHISCNDVASCGAEPVGLLLTILAPKEATTEQLEEIMGQACSTADDLNVDILGGHTEVTDCVNRFVVISTVVGKVGKDNLITTSGAKEGDYIIMTKYAGLEGTAILANDFETELKKHIDERLVDSAKGHINEISVVREGLIAASFGVSSMHDATEGGVLGAIWEVLEASGKGAVVYMDKIPIKEETREICKFFSINPLRLISSGCMIITCNKGEELVQKLNKEGIKATIIGTVTADKRKKLVGSGFETEIEQPEADELYKVVSRA